MWSGPAREKDSSWRASFQLMVPGIAIGLDPVLARGKTNAQESGHLQKDFYTGRFLANSLSLRAVSEYGLHGNCSGRLESGQKTGLLDMLRPVALVVSMERNRHRYPSC